MVDLERARRAGRELSGELSLESELQTFAAFRWRPDDLAYPTLLLDDISGIPFLAEIAGVEEYQHRGRLRAGDHDVYVTVTPAASGYESYCRDRLHMGSPEHLVADPVGPSIAVARACSEGRTLARLTQVARGANGMMVHPYMGIEAVWELAAKLSINAHCPVHVLAPPPPVTWIANDKALFDEVVARVIGREALVETRVSCTREGMESDLRAIASLYPRVGLKRTRCASAMGNAVFDAMTVRDERDVRRAIDDFLERTEWPEGEDVLAVAWLDTELSPSTQLWIPPSGRGEPRLDGVYEQILEGAERVFVGSRPSTLPEPVNRALGAYARMVAAALQEMGYVGRCSFDHLVLGNPHGDFRVLFTECNGRWGGTSTPMSFVDRLVRGRRPAYRAQDVVFSELVGASFDDLLELTGEEAFDASSGRGRFIYYNVGPLHEHGKFDVISIGADPADAERGVLELLPDLLVR